MSYKQVCSPLNDIKLLLTLLKNVFFQVSLNCERSPMNNLNSLLPVSFVKYSFVHTSIHLLVRLKHFNMCVCLLDDPEISICGDSAVDDGVYARIGSPVDLCCSVNSFPQVR